MQATRIAVSFAVGLAASGPLGCTQAGARSSVHPSFKPDALRAVKDSLRLFEIRNASGQMIAKGWGISGQSSFSQSWNDDSLRAERARCGRDGACLQAYLDSISHRPTRSGRWQFWYSTGQLRAVVSFRLAVDVWCGVVPEFVSYEVKVDSFAFYHANGAVLARGVFQASRIHCENLCDGGVDLEAAKLPKKTQFLDSTGARITDARQVVELTATLTRW